MEQPFKVRIEFHVEYDVGSPPDEAIDPWEIAHEDALTFESIWMSRSGPVSQVFGATAGTDLYPPFTDTARRQVFGIFMTTGTEVLGVGFENQIGWFNGILDNPIYIGNLLILTDDGWTANDAFTAIVPIEGQGGSWFACEGELESDYRKWKQGHEENIAL